MGDLFGWLQPPCGCETPHDPLSRARLVMLESEILRQAKQMALICRNAIVLVHVVT